MKRVISIIITAVLICGVLGSCSGWAEQGHRLEILDCYSGDNDEKLTVTFLNTQTDGKETITPEGHEAAEDAKSYQFNVDTEKYDRAVIAADGNESCELALNDYVSGWYITETGVFYPIKSENPIDYEIKTFKYSKTEKNIYIWTPEDYDKKSKEKYSVIYMTDGQNLFEERSTNFGSWGAAESVCNMMQNSDNKAIIVGIDNSTPNRDSELTPDIGDVAELSDKDKYENGTGKYFSDFVYKTVVPYIEKNYNVYTDPEHTAICGSSSGGIESFYIGMEHPDKFGTIGALSPAFALYNDSTWIKYLKTKKFNNYPKIYIYNGGADDLEKLLLTGAESMPENLAKINYPEDKITFKKYDKGQHNEAYWRAVFPEFLKIMFPHSN